MVSLALLGREASTLVKTVSSVASVAITPSSFFPLFGLSFGVEGFFNSLVSTLTGDSAFGGSVLEAGDFGFGVDDFISVGDASFEVAAGELVLGFEVFAFCGDGVPFGTGDGLMSNVSFAVAAGLGGGCIGISDSLTTSAAFSGSFVGDVATAGVGDLDFGVGETTFGGIGDTAGMAGIAGMAAKG